MNSEKITMEVNIAGEIISLTVPFSRQEAVRKTEAELGALYRMWSRELPGKSPRELLALMAYRFASAYLDLSQRQEEATEEAEELLMTASRLVGDDGNGAEDSLLVDSFPDN